MSKTILQEMIEITEKVTAEIKEGLKSIDDNDYQIELKDDRDHKTVHEA